MPARVTAVAQRVATVPPLGSCARRFMSDRRACCRAHAPHMQTCGLFSAIRDTVILRGIRPRQHAPMNRFQVSGIHLSISLVIATLVGCLIYFVWYPHPYFQVAGGSNLMLLIMGVDMVIAPLLTCVVYKAGKKGLGFDLACIAILQTAASNCPLPIIAR